MSYVFLITELEDWQVKSFKFKGQRNKEVVNQSETFIEERLLINESQVYTLSLQGLTQEQMKEIYKTARNYSQISYEPIFYGTSSDPNGFSYNETINMNYIGDSEFGFTTKIDYNKVGISLKGVLYDMTFEIVEER